jgi:hypothetical protein
VAVAVIVAARMTDVNDGPEQSSSNVRKNIPQDEIDEQRLRVYTKVGEVLEVDLQAVPTRSEPAIRTRWTMIQY